MKILLIGSSGNIGRAVSAELAPRHEIIAAGRQHGEVRVDIEDEQSILAMYQQLPQLDAIVIATGGRNGDMAPLTEMNARRFRVGLDSKLLGQVNVVLHGIAKLRDGGSFTLIGGSSDAQSIAPMFSNLFMVNAALDGFVTAAATELPRRLRINLVAPPLLDESVAAYGALFRGIPTVPVAQVAKAYSLSVEGVQTGQIYRFPR